MNPQLTVEVNPTCTRTEEDDTIILKDGHAVVIAPIVGPDYWLLRVRLSADQALLAFPKFGLIGCGFALEKVSWNTNLPLACPAESLYNHIALNSAGIPAETCLTAIQLLQEYALKTGLLTADHFEKMRVIDAEVKAALAKVGL